ncbi:hypothetical protein K523DRAFT_82423 [Schizophyllum commune Tattone D]|nr:hypothetical protein K523DRAFT_82423 [Schizophyllum commune Tattone D]
MLPWSSKRPTVWSQDTLKALSLTSTLSLRSRQCQGFRLVVPLSSSPFHWPSTFPSRAASCCASCFLSRLLLRSASAKRRRAALVTISYAHHALFNGAGNHRCQPRVALSR